MNKEQASEAYIKGKLRDHQEYLGCEESRRMTLIQSDMYTVQKAFEDGWDEAKKKFLERAYKWIEENFENYIGADVSEYDIHDDEFADNFRKAMEE